MRVIALAACIVVGGQQAALALSFSGWSVEPLTAVSSANCDAPMLSGSGLVTVQSCRPGGADFNWTTFRSWNNGRTWNPIGDFRAVDVSGDGTTVVGNHGTGGVIWNNASGTTLLGESAQARGVSRDGTTVFGSEFSEGRMSAVFWENGQRFPVATGEETEDTAAWGYPTDVRVMSPDARFFWGTATFNTSTQPFFFWDRVSNTMRYTYDFGLHAITPDGARVGTAGFLRQDAVRSDVGFLAPPLSDPNGEGPWSRVVSSSDDGSVILGGFSSSASGFEGFVGSFIWDETNGGRLLSEVLAESGDEWSGWEISRLVSISGNAQAVLARGALDGGPIGWIRIAAIPEPTTFGMLMLGLVCLARASSRQFRPGRMARFAGAAVRASNPTSPFVL